MMSYYIIMMSRYINREETFIDTIIKGIKKIRGSERCDLLHLSSLLVLQVGEEHGQLLLVLRPLLSTIIRDHTVTPAERSSVSQCVLK